MKTTLVIADPVVEQLRSEAARSGKTQSEIVEAALRSYFEPPRAARRKLTPLPYLELGEPLADISDREAVYRILDDERSPLAR